MPPPSTSLRAAVVGAGLMGRWHAHAIRHAGSRVVAVIDADMARAESFAAMLPDRPAIVADVGYALRTHPVDVVHVCTPLETHERVTGEAIEAGAHALVEKPLAPDAAGVERLHRLAEDRGVLLCPVHQFLFQRGVLDAERRLAALGRIRHFEVVACSAGADRGTDVDRELVARDILPHALALARRLLGAREAGAGWSLTPSEMGELRASTTWNSTPVAVTVSMHARPTENSLTIRCDGGTVRVNLYHGFATLERGAPSRLEKIARPFAGAALVLGAATGNLARRAVRGESAYPGLRELVARFHRATTGASRSPISAQESIDVARERDTIVAARSAASRVR